MRVGNEMRGCCKSLSEQCVGHQKPVVVPITANVMMITMITTPSEIIQRLRFLHHRALSYRRCCKSTSCDSKAFSTSSSESNISDPVLGFGGRGTKAAIIQARGKMNPKTKEYTWMFLRPKTGSVVESMDGHVHALLECWILRLSWYI